MKVFIKCPNCDNCERVEEVIEHASVTSVIREMDETGAVTEYGTCSHQSMDGADVNYQCHNCGWRLPVSGPDDFALWIASGEHWLVKDGKDAN